MGECMSFLQIFKRLFFVAISVVIATGSVQAQQEPKYENIWGVRCGSSYFLGLFERKAAVTQLPTPIISQPIHIDPVPTQPKKSVGFFLLPYLQSEASKVLPRCSVGSWAHLNPITPFKDSWNKLWETKKQKMQLGVEYYRDRLNERVEQLNQTEKQLKLVEDRNIKLDKDLIEQMNQIKKRLIKSNTKLFDALNQLTTVQSRHDHLMSENNALRESNDEQKEILKARLQEKILSTKNLQSQLQAIALEKAALQEQVNASNVRTREQDILIERERSNAKNAEKLALAVLLTSDLDCLHNVSGASKIWKSGFKKAERAFEDIHGKEVELEMNPTAEEYETILRCKDQTYERQLQDLQAEINMTNATAAHYPQQIEELKTLLEATNSQLDEQRRLTHEAVGNYPQRITHFEQTLSQVQIERDSAYQKLHVINENKQALEAALHREQASVIATNQRLNVVNTELARLKEQQQELKIQHQTEQKDAAQALQKLQWELEECTSEKTALHNQLYRYMGLDEQLENVRIDKVSLQNQVEITTRLATQLQKRINQLNQEREELEQSMHQQGDMNRKDFLKAQGMMDSTCSFPGSPAQSPEHSVVDPSTIGSPKKLNNGPVAVSTPSYTKFTDLTNGIPPTPGLKDLNVTELEPKIFFLDDSLFDHVGPNGNKSVNQTNGSFGSHVSFDSTFGFDDVSQMLKPLIQEQPYK